MIEVAPIKSKKKLNEIQKLLLEKGNVRMLLFFSLGINSALRITDLLNVQVKHLFDEQGEIRESFTLQEQKTKKSHKVKIPDKTSEILVLYREKYPKIITNGENYVFFRAKSNDKGKHPISRVQGWKYIGQWCKAVGLTGNYGGHTLRKTRGYHARKKGADISLIQRKLNHSSQSVTMKYIGISQEEIDDVVDDLNL